MQLGQPRPPVQRLRHYAQPLEVVEQVGFNPFHTGALPSRMLSASMQKVRYFVLIRPLFPFASWICIIWVYSPRILSKSFPLGGMVMARAKVSWDAARSGRTAGTGWSCQSS